MTPTRTVAIDWESLQQSGRVRLCGGRARGAAPLARPATGQSRVEDSKQGFVHRRDDELTLDRYHRCRGRPGTARPRQGAWHCMWALACSWSRRVCIRSTGVRGYHGPVLPGSRTSTAKGLFMILSGVGLSGASRLESVVQQSVQAGSQGCGGMPHTK